MQQSAKAYVLIFLAIIVLLFYGCDLLIRR
jgi:preprotein translocase subunit SecE